MSPVDPAVAAPADTTHLDQAAAPTSAPVRSKADRRMRTLLRLPEDAPPTSILDAQSAFSKSIFISGTRCVITYLLLPLLGPVVGLSGAWGPWIGILLGLVSMTAIWFATRRFFAADHRYRWGYFIVGGAIFVGMIVSIGFDISRILT